MWCAPPASFSRCLDSSISRASIWNTSRTMISAASAARPTDAVHQCDRHCEEGGRKLRRDCRDEPFVDDVAEAPLVERLGCVTAMSAKFRRLVIAKIPSTSSPRRDAGRLSRVECTDKQATDRAGRPGRPGCRGSVTSSVTASCAMNNTEADQPDHRGDCGSDEDHGDDQRQERARQEERPAASRTAYTSLSTAVVASRTTRPIGCQSEARLVATMPARHAAVRTADHA